MILKRNSFYEIKNKAILILTSPEYSESNALEKIAVVKSIKTTETFGFDRIIQLFDTKNQKLLFALLSFLTIKDLYDTRRAHSYFDDTIQFWVTKEIRNRSDYYIKRNKKRNNKKI